MGNNQLLWQMTAQQFAAFDTHLYLDTHQHDKTALQMYRNYQKAYESLAKEYEELYGPLSAGSAAKGTWEWIKDPWPWEREAN